MGFSLTERNNDQKQVTLLLVIVKNRNNISSIMNPSNPMSTDYEYGQEITTTQFRSRPYG